MKTTGNSRRIFLSDSAKAIIGATVAAGTVGSMLESCGTAKSSAGSVYKTGFTQDPLPYSYNSLDKSIDGLTMEIHYTKHAASYATNLRDAAAAEGVDTRKPLEDVLTRISKYSTKMRNNGGGHYNHELFWKTLSPNSDFKPSGRLLTAIEENFNSYDAFKNQFTDAAKNRFGSGWAWLVVGNDKKLRIGSTANQDNPLMDVSDFKGFPLLGLDVWEHAYYLRYQNKRPDYITAWWNVVNWNYVESRFESVK